MKVSLKIFLALLLSFSMLFAFSCEGEPGPVGPAGEKGDKGDTGADGAQGEKGDTGTVENTCFKCHSAEGEFGSKMSNAQAGSQESVHMNGFRVAITDSNGDILGYEWEGSDAFYANGGGCQTCHTREGFLKDQSGEYTDTNPASDDAIATPNPLDCFTCHKPHTNGNFDLIVANGTAVDILGGQYKKEKGNICASCHQARSGGATANDYSLTTAKAGSMSSRFGPHYGPQSDLLLGLNGAEFAGKTYGDSAHTGMPTANCVTCHMTKGEARHSLSANVGGHSFNVVGIVHGAPKGNADGCKTCHTDAVAATSTTELSFYPEGTAYLKKTADDTAVATFDKLLTKLADPSKNCDGLLTKAYGKIVSGAKVNFSSDGKCTPAGVSKAMTKDDARTEDANETKFVMAYWNYRYIGIDDKSKSIHNPKYAIQLLKDSCDVLAGIAGEAGACDDVTRP